MYFLAGYGTTLAGGSTHGQTWHPIDRRAMGQERTAPPTVATQPARWPPLGRASGGHRGHPLGPEDRGTVVRPAGGVSESVDVLAAVEALGRGRHVAPPLARVHRRGRRARAVAVGDGGHRWHLCPGEKRGSDIGPTKRGKGSKCMVLVERQGLPLGLTITSASPAEVTLVDQTLATRVTPHRRNPTHLLGDKASDSDPCGSAWRPGASSSPAPIAASGSIARTKTAAGSGPTSNVGSWSGLVRRVSSVVDSARAVNSHVSGILSIRRGTHRAAEVMKPVLVS